MVLPDLPTEILHLCNHQVRSVRCKLEESSSYPALTFSISETKLAAFCASGLRDLNPSNLHEGNINVFIQIPVKSPIWDQALTTFDLR